MNLPDHKFFNDNEENEEEENRIITWEAFEPNSIKCESFWSWFYSVTLLTRDRYRILWNLNCIVGFISTTKAEELLEKCEMNTFLLRFSDRLFANGKFSQ